MVLVTDSILHLGHVLDVGDGEFLRTSNIKPAEFLTCQAVEVHLFESDVESCSDPRPEEGAEEGQEECGDTDVEHVESSLGTSSLDGLWSRRWGEIVGHHSIHQGERWPCATLPYGRQRRRRDESVGHATVPQCQCSHWCMVW